MAETRVMGFWEAWGPEGEGEVATTLVAVEVEELLGRLRARLTGAEPGSLIRLDLIVWGEDF